MYRRIDEFIGQGTITKKEQETRKKKKRLRETRLDLFLPEEHVDYFKNLRIGSKKIRNAKIEEL
ncbi:MAG: hypothetical protein J7K48_07000 [Thermococcus sp.]|uniref:Uncharacterized protein n=1 Tax=Thermococcus guaymasensis DSM 11113 TaxID=1432656 RepID=A0A0X1KLT6_9EURY|nr:PCNA-inhibitor [Thermococcus guaymasensis]AJC72237.1 hypothetical protein X802_08880 [Thermococcus guaymasensis DSM 11113]MCD6524718.1 hypothetical protein [Thermococcus sp.]